MLRFYRPFLPLLLFSISSPLPSLPSLLPSLSLDQSMFSLFLKTFFFPSQSSQCQIQTAKKCGQMKTSVFLWMFLILLPFFTSKMGLSCWNGKHPKPLQSLGDCVPVIKVFRDRQNTDLLILISCASTAEIAARCMRLWLDVHAPLRAINLSFPLSSCPVFYTIITPKWT